MSFNSFGHLFRFTTWGESHGPAIGCVVDGVPPRIALSEADIQPWLDRRRPGQSRFTTQRRESDRVRILSGLFEGRTTGTPISLLIENEDQRSKDYSKIAEKFRPGHADYTYWQKYGVRDARGGGRASARETLVRVAAGAVAKKWLGQRYGVEIRGCLSSLGAIDIPFKSWDVVDANPFFSANASQARESGTREARAKNPKPATAKYGTRSLKKKGEPGRTAWKSLLPEGRQKFTSSRGAGPRERS